jgi:hypothetical protein
MWGKRKYTQGFGTETKEREHLEDLGVERRIILKWVLKK